MTRTALILIVLLVASNAVWVVLWLGKDTQAVDTFTETSALEQTVDELEQEVERLRSQGPVLVGVGERGPDATAPGARRPDPEGNAPADGAARLASGSPEAVAAREEAVKKAAARDAAYAAAKVKATEMLRKVMQVEDPALRREGLAEIADALKGEDPYLIEYTLSVMHSIRDVDFDRAGFIGLVQQHMDSENGGIRRSALYAMAAVNPDGVDTSLLLESAKDEDPRVRSHIARILAQQGGKTFEGESADAVMRLLSDEDATVRKGTLRGLSGAQVTPEMERRLIEMAADSPERGEAVYFGLSPMQNKSRGVVDALFSSLEDESHKIRARAHWGLQRGVAKEQQYYVAERYAGRLGKFLNPKSHREALRLIVRYGDASLAPQLERFAENEMVDADVRTLAGKAAEYLTLKKPSR